MAASIPYINFTNLNITWVEDNVADMHTLDYLGLSCASDEEISSAEPVVGEKATKYSMAFVGTYISLKLKHFVIEVCKAAPHQKFYVLVKHMGCRGKDILTIHIEVSSVPLDSGQPFKLWFHYDVKTITDCKNMCRELSIWKQRLSQEK